MDDSVVEQSEQHDAVIENRVWTLCGKFGDNERPVLYAARAALATALPAEDTFMMVVIGTIKRQTVLMPGGKTELGWDVNVGALTQNMNPQQLATMLQGMFEYLPRAQQESIVKAQLTDAVRAVDPDTDGSAVVPDSKPS